MKRKAFLVGINRYPDPRNNLKGCVNDALLMAKTLREQYAFTGPSDVRLLTDERATTANIRDMKWKVTYRKLLAATGAALADHNFDHVPQLEGPARILSQTVFVPAAERV